MNLFDLYLPVNHLRTHKPTISICWFRRDLRLEDHTALNAALQQPIPVLPLFIFDENILEELPLDDARVTFIHDQLSAIHTRLRAHGSSLLCRTGEPLEVWEELIRTFDIGAVYTNRDYEPYALQRDAAVEKVLHVAGIPFHTFSDQLIFEPGEVLKADRSPYTIFTPFRNTWMQQFRQPEINNDVNFRNLYVSDYPLPTLKDLGFERSEISVPAINLQHLDNYAAIRDFPWLDQTSYLSTHLRFGTVSIRSVIAELKPTQQAFLNELIWREFFMHIIFHFPKVVGNNFLEKYDAIRWRNNEEEFERWCAGNTGYPLVDAGMRQLNKTGLMHNRVRMVTASFLCKHLLIDWRWGEAYFAEKLLDYDLSANNGNWQWAAGTGCDAAPYFRVFNPSEQQKKFDPDFAYIRKWVPEFDTPGYARPIIDHSLARKRALDCYHAALQ